MKNEELRVKKDTMNDEMKYEEALAQLETIVRKMEANELDIDEIAAQLKTAQRLIKLCRDKLTKTEAELLEEQTDGQ
jgi:exodeoxyribonuclease VII small subunit